VHCFNKTQRLLKKSEYDNVFSKAKRLVTSYFIILYCENQVGHARLGLALSKKMIAKAHDRNRIKRLVRESFRTGCLPAVDVVVLARPGLAQIQNSIITAKLSKTWDKLCEK
jgi:ribonuclease P protein component